MSDGAMFRALRNDKQRGLFSEKRAIAFLWDGAQTVWKTSLAYLMKPKTIH